MIRPLLVAVALLGACTKVNEQPPAPQTAPLEQVPRQATAPRPTAKLRSPTWTSAWVDDQTRPPTPKLAARPDAAPAPATLNGDPKGLEREALQKILDAAMPAFAACFDGVQGSHTVALSFDADPAGRANNVRVQGGGPGAERCVSGVAAGLSLPSFSGNPVPVHFPLSIRGTTTTPPPAAAKAEPPAQPAPVFVNP
jgi:hypothetical protein